MYRCLSVHRDILEIIPIHKHTLVVTEKLVGTHQEMVEPFYIKPDLHVNAKIWWRYGRETVETWQPRCPLKGDTLSLKLHRGALG